MTATASARGRANRARGHRAETAVVAWLRAHGHPDAATTRSRLGHDGFSAPGDVIGVPALVIEVKSVQGSAWPTWCRQAATEARDTPWCVVRRTRGEPDVGRWPCVASPDAIATDTYNLTATRQHASVLRLAAQTGYWHEFPTVDGVLFAGRFGWLFDGSAS